MIAGVGAMLLLGAARSQPVSQPPAPLRPVEVTLHRFDMQPGSEGKFREWIAFLQSRRREAVATLSREHTYVEAMFTAPDEPRRLYWITVTGEGGAPVESSTSDLDRKHQDYMDAVLAKGSHRRLNTENVLLRDFIVRAIRDQQRREGAP